MIKSKKKALTDTDRPYTSEKEVMIDGKKAWLKKIGNHIEVTQGKKTIYSGPAGGWHRFIRTGKTQDQK